MKGILTELNQKAKTWLSPRHPFYDMDRKSLLYYCAAIYLQTKVGQKEQKGQREEHFELLRLYSAGFELQNNEIYTILKLSKKQEEVINYVLSFCKNKRQQAVFLLDLYNVSYINDGFGEKELEVIQLYIDTFHISEVEATLIREFVAAAYRKETVRCMNLCSNMMEFQIDLQMADLKYYFPEMSYTTVIDVNGLQEGKTLVLQDRCELREELHVKRGMKLILRNAIISMNAPIIVEGGELEVYHSDFHYKKGEYAALLLIESNKVISIKECNFYCSNMCGAIRQSAGKLKIEYSHFYNTNNESAVTFFGEELEVTKCRFYDCFVSRAGAAVSVQSGIARVTGSAFYRCKAQVGGAIYAKAPSVIFECRFYQCHAREFGNSIYYRGSIENRVSYCQYKNDSDLRKECIQFLTKDEKLPKEIKDSAVFEEGFWLKQRESLKIKNAIIYLEDTARIEGEIWMEQVMVKPYRFSGRDLFDASNAGECIMKHCILDGSEMCGLIRATGTIVKAFDVIFKDTAGGRAVYESLRFECDSCVFLNCRDGAVYGTTARIINSAFINCLSEKGGAIQLKGNRGVIDKCSFERCKALMKGGAISAFGNYQITRCSFYECEPENISS